MAADELLRGLRIQQLRRRQRCPFCYAAQQRELCSAENALQTQHLRAGNAAVALRHGIVQDRRHFPVQRPLQRGSDALLKLAFQDKIGVLRFVNVGCKAEEGGDKDDRTLRQRRVELLCQLNAGHFIHLDIEDGDVRRIAVHMHRLQKRRRRIKQLQLRRPSVSMGAHRLREPFPVQRFVVTDRNVAQAKLLSGSGWL